MVKEFVHEDKVFKFNMNIYIFFQNLQMIKIL